MTPSNDALSQERVTAARKACDDYSYNNERGAGNPLAFSMADMATIYAALDAVSPAAPKEAIASQSCKEGELLPCPFCGRKPAFDPETDEVACREENCYLILNWMPKAAWQKRAIAPMVNNGNLLKLPTNEFEAEWMQKVGYRWIADNAPHKLTEQARETEGLLKEAHDALVYCRIKYWGVNDEPKIDLTIAKLYNRFAGTNSVSDTTTQERSFEKIDDGTCEGCGGYGSRWNKHGYKCCFLCVPQNVDVTSMEIPDSAEGVNLDYKVGWNDALDRIASEYHLVKKHSKGEQE